MSTFSAGSIVGTLGMDASEFSEATRESTSLAGIFAESIGQILTAATDSPLLGELANGISEVVAAAGRGNWGEAFAASIHTASAAVTGMIEVVKGEAESMHEFGLAAERAGVSVEWMSSFGKAAEAYGVPVEQLSMYLKFLQMRAAEAVDGNKELQHSFAEAGMSVDFLKDHLNDVQGIFDATVRGLGGITTAGEQTKVAMALLARGGQDLKPIFEDGGKGADELAAQIKQLGGSFTEADAETGLAMGKMGAKFAAVWDDFKKKTAEPVLDFLIENEDTIIADSKIVETWLGEKIPKGIKTLEDACKHFDIKTFLDQLGQVSDDVKTLGWVGEGVMDVVKPVWNFSSSLLNDTVGRTFDFGSEAWEDFQNDHPYSRNQGQNQAFINDFGPRSKNLNAAPVAGPNNSSGNSTLHVVISNSGSPQAIARAVGDAVSNSMFTNLAQQLAAIQRAGKVAAEAAP